MRRSNPEPRLRPLDCFALLAMTGKRSTNPSYDLQELQLAVVNLHPAEAACGNVADLVELTRTGNALVVDVLARGEQLQSFDRGINLLAVALADFSDVVLQRDAG